MRVLTIVLAYVLVFGGLIVLFIPLTCFWALTDDDMKGLRHAQDS